MPIYEYYCASCHRVYNFLVRNIGAHRPPSCPRCGRGALERKMSRFAAIRGRAGGDAGNGDDLGLDGIDENDPRAMAAMMRRMGEEMRGETGEDLGPEFDEMVRRLEAGEDPETIERDLEERSGEGDAAGPAGPPPVDEGLYEG